MWLEVSPVHYRERPELLLCRAMPSAYIEDICLYRAFYQDGHLAPAVHGGTSVEPKPSAANEGTLITVSDASCPWFSHLSVPTFASLVGRGSVLQYAATEKEFQKSSRRVQ